MAREASDQSVQTAILLHDNDNVVTLLSDRRAGDVVTAVRGSDRVRIVLRDDVRFGHKAALVDIDEGSDVVKYGMPIGRALEPIAAGRWVHVHNCRSHRFGHYQEKYGIHA
jgi:hypothetical protein